MPRCVPVCCRLSKTDQERVFPNSVTFECPEDQEAFVREWAQKRTGLACDFKVKFYPGRYAPEKGEAQQGVQEQRPRTLEVTGQQARRSRVGAGSRRAAGPAAGSRSSRALGQPQHSSRAVVDCA